jgi:hypothetical protein
MLNPSVANGALDVVGVSFVASASTLAGDMLPNRPQVRARSGVVREALAALEALRLTHD